MLLNMLSKHVANILQHRKILEASLSKLQHIGNMFLCRKMFSNIFLCCNMFRNILATCVYATTFSATYFYASTCSATCFYVARCSATYFYAATRSATCQQNVQQHVGIMLPQHVTAPCFSVKFWSKLQHVYCISCNILFVGCSTC